MAASHRVHGLLLASCRGDVDYSIRLDIKLHQRETPVPASSDALLPGQSGFLQLSGVDHRY